MTLADRIRLAREERRWSQAKLAERVGISQAAINRIEKGIAVKSKHLPDIKKELGLVDKVPIVGLVGAGNSAHYFSEGDNPCEEAETPPQSTDETVAVRVRGTSMYPICDDGDILYYDDVRTPPTDDLIGRLCVVGLSDGNVVVKRVHHGSLRGRYDLLSTNAPPVTNVEVAWAARVKWIKPR